MISKKLTLALLITFLVAHNFCSERAKYVGIFRPHLPTLSGIKYGNWGSRPYEYAWASSVISVKDKRVIDLGVGLPSQHNWYQYVLTNLKPSFYAGIDADSRILNELITEKNFEMRHMNMAEIKYEDKSFDIAYCISVFEQIPSDILIKTIQEAHRILNEDGLLIMTFDEAWDKNQFTSEHNNWNILELDLIKKNQFIRKKRSFGLPEFLELVKDYFILYEQDANLDKNSGMIRSSTDHYIYYHRINRDPSILNSGSLHNSCVSYAVLKKVN